MTEYKFTIDSKEYFFKTDQDVGYGPDEVILENDIDFMKSYPEGYAIHKLPIFKSEALNLALQNFIKKQVLDSTGISIEDLSKYHESVNNEIHEKFIKDFSKGFNVSLVDELNFLDDEISNLTSIKASPKSPYNGENKFWMRIIRPGILENNPAHKDVYLSYLRNAVNIYLPLVGSTKKSSLSIMPKSHMSNEKDILRTISGAKVGKREFTVPAILKIKDSLDLTRPNPNYDELMVFSPYLVHGAGINEEMNTTRISLEMRFWPKAGL